LAQHGVPNLLLDFTRRTPIRVVRLYFSLRRIVRHLQPDVIHVHTLTPAVLAQSLIDGPPVVATVHNEFQRGVWLMRYADAVVGVSQAVTLAMQSRNTGAGKAFTVLNGTVGSLRRVAVEQLPQVGLSRPAIVTVGAISERKGADVLLEAFGRVVEHVPSAHLYYVGNRDWPAFEELLESKPWADRVHLVGFKSQPQAYLREAAVFVLPSRRDPFALVLLEALEAGCAIVGSDVDGIPEALAHGRAGLLAAVNDPKDLADKILQVLMDEELAQRLRAMARERSSSFTVNRMSQNYLTLYRSLVC
ncbi:MAG TPA: glycosyltransferase family 4 protein, partial [Chloroflexia bacterium]|nr:glycosyltransferase family 4 protein [Chloroflexia bacterium]